MTGADEELPSRLAPVTTLLPFEGFPYPLRLILMHHVPQERGQKAQQGGQGDGVGTDSSCSGGGTGVNGERTVPGLTGEGSGLVGELLGAWVTDGVGGVTSQIGW